MMQSLRRRLTPCGFSTVLVALALLFSVSAAEAAPRAPDLVLEGVLTGAAHETYTEVPFKVPGGVERLTVEFAYTGREERSVIDLGLRDPHRFRGWSGGNKAQFTVAESDATPSYLPGPLPAGTWRLVLGAPNIRKTSRPSYTARIWFERRGVSFSGFADAPLRAEPGWFRGDLHMHTGHSDGSCATQAGKRAPCPVYRTPEAAAGRGLDFIAITDHNATSHFAAMRELQGQFDRLLLIPGREVTTFFGHANLFGPTAFIDFQLGGPRARSLDAILDQVDRSGGLFSINHPGMPSGEACMGCGWTAPADFSRIAAVEVVNGGQLAQDGAADGPLSGIPFWEARLNEGLRVTAIGGSDNHDALLPAGKAPAIGVPTTVVRAQALSQAAILEGLRRGEVFIDIEGTRERLLEVKASSGSQQAVMGGALRLGAQEPVALEARVRGVAGGELQLVGPAAPKENTAAIRSADQTLRLDLLAPSVRGWVRVDVRDTAGRLVLIGNPIYFERP